MIAPWKPPVPLLSYDKVFICAGQTRGIASLRQTELHDKCVLPSIDITDAVFRRG